MHVPDKWEMKSKQELHNFIDSYGFATIISEDLEASHLPLYFKPDEGDYGVLYGHFAKSNSHWKLINGAKVLVIFSGPHSYISPSWYETQPAVPTWNYSAVHVIGNIELTSQDITTNVLDEMVLKYEPDLYIPKNYKSRLSTGIVGFKINIHSMKGKEKLGQHRSITDQKNVTSALSHSENLDSLQLYRYMIKKNIGTGH